MPHPHGFYPGICLTSEKKARKNLSQNSHILKEKVFRHMTPRHMVNNYQHLRGAFNLNLQSLSSSWIAQNLNMETRSFSETSEISLQTI